MYLWMIPIVVDNALVLFRVFAESPRFRSDITRAEHSGIYWPFKFEKKESE
jgi:hypothetical protein